MKEKKENIDEKISDVEGIIEETGTKISENVEKALGNIEDKLEKTEESIEESEEAIESVSKKQEKQIKWVLIAMIAIIAIVFFIAFSVDEVKKFDYIGLEWKKEMFGKIPIYNTEVEGVDEYGRNINFRLNIRNDPRKLNVPFEGEIGLMKTPVYFSINFTDEAQRCSPAPLVNFGMFMAGMGYKIESVVAEEKYLDMYGQEFVDCFNKPNKTVIIYTSGEETKIITHPENPNCYIITFNKCKNTEALETFEVEMISKLTNVSKETGLFN